MSLIGNLSFQIFFGFEEYCRVFYDPITKWLEKYYSTISIAINRFQTFLVLTKEDDTEEGAFTISLQGSSDYAFCQRGKNVDWMKVVIVRHISTILHTFKCLCNLFKFLSFLSHITLYLF